MEDHSINTVKNYRADKPAQTILEEETGTSTGDIVVWDGNLNYTLLGKSFVLL